MSKVRVGVVQASPVLMDKAATLQKVSKLCQEAKQGGAELVLFPEAFVSCYPRGCDFGTIVGSRTDEGRELYKLYAESSVEIPGPAVDTLSEIAKDYDIHLVIGVIERDSGTLYCTVLFFDNLGSYLGKHRKLMPTAQERVVWGQGDGSTLPVYETKVGKIGAVICWENYMPLLRTAMYAKGIEIYCAPTADTRDTWTASMRHIAQEGRCFVLGCNQFVRVKDYPASMNPNNKLFPGKTPDEITCRGGSIIVSPLGKVLAGPVYDEEVILYADLDLGEITRGKMDFDVVGHYARNDVFKLVVNESKREGVVFEGNN